MSRTNLPPHYQRIKDAQNNGNEFIYGLLIGMSFVIIAIWIGSLIFSEGYATNVYTEILSVMATILVLDQLSDWRETRRLKTRLIREAGGQSNETVRSAIDWMKAENWISGRNSLLKHANLSEANWVGVSLEHSNLEGADFGGTNLKDTYLGLCNLSHSDLREANFENAMLPMVNFYGAILYDTEFKNTDCENANFQNTNLEWVTFEGAHLRFVDFKGASMHHCILINANLKEAKLQGADLLNANVAGVYLEDTWLPDGTICHYGNEITLQRFTDPKHRNYTATKEIVDKLRERNMKNPTVYNVEIIY